MAAQSLVEKLLIKGHWLAVEHGRLRLRSNSNQAVPDGWLHENKSELIGGILKQTGIDALQYESYSTGNYRIGHAGAKMAGGVTLQFSGLLTKANCYAVFNADLTRQRSTRSGKAGEPLPKRQFRVGKQSGFRKFWLRTELTQPPRLSSFHDYMGKLKQIIFVAKRTYGERLESASLQPLSLNYPELLKAFDVDPMPDNFQTRPGQQPDNYRTIYPDKKIAQSHTKQEQAPNSTTGTKIYGTKSQGNAATREPYPTPLTAKDIKQQTTDEWLADYYSADANVAH